MTDSPPTHVRANPEVTRFREGPRVYERRYVDCGKANCSKCSSDHGRYPSHGPYWYLCATFEGKWIRIYLGRDLDSFKFVLPDGNVDWKQIDAGRKKPRSSVSRSSSPKSEAKKKDSLSRASGPPRENFASADEYDEYWEKRAKKQNSLLAGTPLCPGGATPALLAAPDPVQPSVDPSSAPAALHADVAKA